MSRRADPERVYLARRAATFRRLTATGAIDELDAEFWIRRWEREAERQGLDRFTPTFWEAGRAWVAVHRYRPGALLHRDQPEHDQL